MSWPTRPLKWVASSLDGRRIPIRADLREAGPYPYFGANGIQDYVADYLFDEEVVLIGEDGAPFFDPLKNVAWRVTEKCWVNNHAHVVRPERIHGGYLAYALNTVDYRLYVTGSTRDKLTAEAMGNIRLPYPPLDEQRRIADFLDRETARIDELIATRDEQVHRLNERIDRVMLDELSGRCIEIQSGRYEWWGDLPSGWTVEKIGWHYSSQLGKMLDEAAFKNATGEYLPYLRNTNVQWFRIDTTDTKLMPFSTAERTKFSLKRGDLLVCEGGEVGRSAMWEDEDLEMYFQKALHRVRPRGDYSNQYLMFMLRASARLGVFRRGANQSTIMHLTGEQLASYRLPFPGPSLQRTIAARIHSALKQCSEVQVSIAEAQAKLREYRRSLITEAVTGQLDPKRMRGAAMEERLEEVVS